MTSQLRHIQPSPEQARRQSNEDGTGPKRPACSECRRKKIRCIGTGDPPCQNCLEAGVECVYVEGKKRGPAKGYFDVITKRRMEEMLETVVCAPRRTEPSGSEGISDSEEYSVDEDQGEYRRSPRGRRTADEDLKTSLQIMDLQTLEMDSASSPYSYAFRIDAFNRKVSAVDGEFQNLGQGKYLRQGPVQITATDASPLDPYLADHLVEVYFRDLWPLFPIVDKDAVYNQLQDTNPQLPNGLLTAIYLAAASTISQRSSNSGARSAISTPSLSPRTSLPFPPALVETLRSTLATAVSNLSSPTLEPRITSIQTITLLCLYDRTLSSEQRLVLISDLVRMGQYILLHRSITNISTRDKSLRKHLWWTIFLLEVWTSACDRSPSTIDLAEVDIQLPIEAEEIGHQAYTALVALTRILLDTLRKVYLPTVKSEEVSTEVIRLRGWVNDWYNNLPRELLVSEGSTDADTAEFLLSGCHAVLLLLYHPFRNEEVVRTEINRSRGIITDAIGRLGGNIGKFGIIAKLIGELARTVGT